MLDKFLAMSPASRVKNLQRSNSPEHNKQTIVHVPEAHEEIVPEPLKELKHPLELYRAIDQIKSKDEIEKQRRLAEEKKKREEE